MDTGPRRLNRAALAAAACLALAACGGRKYPAYSPHENILSIATEFQLLAAQDPYYDPPARDLAGQTLARATLVRLENYQELHPERFAPEIDMLRARALEWLGDLAAAERIYDELASTPGELRDTARSRLAALRRVTQAPGAPDRADELLARLEQLAAESRAYADLTLDSQDPFYASLARREWENADVRRAELIAANVLLLPNGEELARSALDELVRTHQNSARALEHALRLGDFHADMARLELRLNPPGQAFFDRARFQRHYEAAADLYYRVSQADGRPERLVAKHRLDALLALGTLVSQRAD
ncbi:MAG: hypothetical protein SF028_13255 [Candidatus Sumerlaeia bacterium]|nr:hypothetical protein [Candidatus Sumerlaeia bacterium]